MQRSDTRNTPVLITLLIALSILSTPGIWASPPTLEEEPGATSNHSYHSLINWQFEDPSDLSVVIIPSAYYSRAAFIDDNSWLTGNDPIRDYPGVAAVLEAIDYWDWMLDQYPAQGPVLSQIDWQVRILGVDALPGDIAEADIVVASWMVHESTMVNFHLGVGLPVPFPPPSTQDQCIVYNSGLGWPADVPHTRLRNLAVHEFGHCISAGHTYDTDGETRLTAENDVMAGANGEGRQCLSNLNVKSVAEGYRFLVDPNSSPGPGQTSIPVDDYHQRCMQDDLKRF